MDRRARGVRAESAVCAWLEEHGYFILDRNVRVGRLEIDIVARKENLVVIVEVRMRGDGAFQKPLASIDAKKRESILRAAEGLWRAVLKNEPDVRMRIDVAGVRFEGDETIVEYVPGAISR